MIICQNWLMGQVQDYWSVINTTGDDRGREVLILQRFPLWLVKHNPVANLSMFHSNSFLCITQCVGSVWQVKTACRGLIPYLWYLGWAKKVGQARRPSRKAFPRSSARKHTLLTLHHVVFHWETDRAINKSPVSVIYKSNLCMNCHKVLPPLG